MLLCPFWPDVDRKRIVGNNGMYVMTARNGSYEKSREIHRVRCYQEMVAQACVCSWEAGVAINMWQFCLS